MKLSELLQVTRKSRKLTLMQLVKKTGISYSMLYRILNDELQKPKPDILKKLAEPLGLEYNYLLQKSGYIQEAESDDKQTLHSVPILSWEYCKHLFPFREPINSGLSDQHYPISTTPNNTFAVVINDEQEHFPLFQSGDLIVCQPQDAYANLDKVIYWDVNEKSMCFGVINEHNGQAYVDDMDARKGQASIACTGAMQDLIVGKVTQHHIKFESN